TNRAPRWTTTSRNLGIGSSTRTPVANPRSASIPSIKLKNKLAQRATNKKMLRQPNFLSAMSVVKLEENRQRHKRFSSATRVANASYLRGMEEVLGMDWESSRIQWQGSCSGCMVNRGIIGIMNSSAHLTVSGPVRRVKRTKGQKKRGRPRGGKG